MSDSISVLYLHRRANNPLFLRAFLESVRKHSAGANYSPVIIYKGFEDGYVHPLAATWATADGQAAKSIYVSDDGFDLTAYRTASFQLESEYCLYLNSYSRILGKNWLRLYIDALGQLRPASVVGATGSWTSTEPDLPFPSPHLRTTAILLRRELFLSFNAPLDTKEQCVIFESGAGGLSHDVLRNGGELALISRSGKVVKPQDWPEACIYYSGDQEELLVGDNRTHEYQVAKPRSRKRRSIAAWGADRATPIGRSLLARNLLHVQWKLGLPVA